MAKAAYNLSPNDVNVAYLFGRLAFQSGNYQLAASVLQVTAQNQPANPMLLHDFAEAAYSVGKVPDAQTAMHNALQAGLAPPQSDEARQFLDLVALSANPVQAIAAESRIVDLLKSDPQLVPALMASATIDEQKADLVAAEQAYEKVLGRYPDFVPAQRRLAVLYAEDSGDIERAYALAIKARESFPNDAELGKALGIIAFRQGDYAHATSLLEECAAEQSPDAELFYYLGASQYRLADRAESKASLQRALSMNLSGKLTTDAKQMLAELK
jgi:tetratricopeptide (TPR) repeat protein